MAYVLLDNSRAVHDQSNSHYFYGKYERICCSRPEAVVTCLHRVDQARRTGKYLVGYIAYEAAYCLNEKLLPLFDYSSNNSNNMLVDFYIFENHELLKPREVESILANHVKEARSISFAYNFRLNFNQEFYNLCLEKLHQYIRDGETYQVNFTGEYAFCLQGDIVQFYRELRKRQRVEFGALFDFANFQLLSFSPELFFEKKGEYLRSKPMKGTMPKADVQEADKENRAQLVDNEKIIAENMIVVDLIRNDLSMIAQPKSVKVAKLFEIEDYETVHQLTSTIACTVDENISFSKIISAIFPCGSITGAPKVRTMEIIRELEKRNRGIYTGAIGYITPQNDMCFNVAIRTLHLNDGYGAMGAGGGIVYDSNSEDEFAEIETKAKFLTELNVPFNLIECFLYESTIGFRYLDLHLQRLCESAKTFAFQFPKSDILNKLNTLAGKLEANQPYKIKVVLQKNGHYSVFHQKTRNESHTNKVKICRQNINTANNVLFFHKTDIKEIRDLYDEIFNFERKSNHCLFDVIFMNKHGFITEGSKSNIFISKNGNILTPAISCGVLPGIMRKNFMIENPIATEALLTEKEIISADKIWLTNSVVGVIEVELI